MIEMSEPMGDDLDQQLERLQQAVTDLQRQFAFRDC
jgi:hypothetical protein